MIDLNDLSLLDVKDRFDFKGFLVKTLSYWKWFLVSLVIAFFIAYQVNLRKEKVYEIGSVISIKEENNPIFSSNTSLVFNWGGVSDKVQTMGIEFKSRSHNEMVVRALGYHVDYLTQEKYFMKDMYGSTPFRVLPENDFFQLYNRLIEVKAIDEKEY